MTRSNSSSNSSERRPSAELALKYSRRNEVQIANQRAQSALVIQFKGLTFAEQPIAPSMAHAPVLIPSEVVSNVINLASERDERVLSDIEREQASNLAAAEQAVAAAHEHVEVA